MKLFKKKIIGVFLVKHSEKFGSYPYTRLVRVFSDINKANEFINEMRNRDAEFGFNDDATYVASDLGEI